ncbi:hypothetical protein, partial [Frankia sp. AgKG'84/4]|uniref:hypothetical protein n=1 Tax=Frankia sp. AgKG'84/4 TaxID=573490 RepID=UPI00202A314D
MTSPTRSTGTTTEQPDGLDPEAVGFEPDTSSARRLPDGHADGRAAVRPDEFAPPEPATPASAETSAAVPAP